MKGSDQGQGEKGSPWTPWLSQAIQNVSNVLVCIIVTREDYLDDIRRGSEVSRSGGSPGRDGSMFWLTWVQKCVPYAIEHPYEI